MPGLRCPLDAPGDRVTQNSEARKRTEETVSDPDTFGLYFDRTASRPLLVIARSEATKQSRTVISELWIASLRSQ